jgi:hypothetical protein
MGDFPSASLIDCRPMVAHIDAPFHIGLGAILLAAFSARIYATGIRIRRAGAAGLKANCASRCK